MGTDEKGISEAAPQDNVLQSDDELSVNTVPRRNGTESAQTGGRADQRDVGKTGADRRAESERYDEMGSADEQSQARSSRDSYSADNNERLSNIKPLPSINEQTAFIAEYEAEVTKASAFSVSPGKNSDDKFRYQLLSRMQSDCNYMLGNGGAGAIRYLDGENVDTHIHNMLELYNSFSDNAKPEWISVEEIEGYREKLTALVAASEKEIQQNSVEKAESQKPEIPSDVDKFYVQPEIEQVTWIYYNPDSAAGGQLVYNYLTYDDIFNAVLKDDPMEYLLENCKQETLDRGSAGFDGAVEEFMTDSEDISSQEENYVGKLLALTEPRYAIYQLKDGEELRDYRFTNSEYMQAHGMYADRENYNQVYRGRMQENETLEDIFAKFNVNRPEDFHGHSLSVSDIICVKQNGKITAHFDDSKVDSHTAITPTALVPNDLSGMSENERKAYTLLALSIIRTVYPKAVTENIKAVFQIDNQLFTAIGTNIINPGWFAVDATPEVTGLPEIVKDNDYKVIGFDVKEGQNEPPKYYTDATLLTAMELAGNNITDEQTRSYIKLTKRGLGTAATRQGIIKELYDKGYIARRTRKNGNAVKSIMPTEKGMYIINTLEKIVPDMLSVDMTGDMEMELDKISRGESDGNNYLNEYKKLVIKWVEQIKNSDTSAMTGNTLICPLCGKPVIKKKVGWCCTGYSKDNPDSCKFYIANEICGKKISDVIAKELILKRATSIIKGFTSQSGKSFDAKLIIKDDNTIGFEFPERLKCPICGKEMVKSSKGWVCTGYRSGCSFFISGTICGKCITETIAAMLCANKRTRIINGFTSKAGKAFSAALVVKDGKIDFDFPSKSQKRNK